MADLSQYDKVLKDVYADKIAEQLNSKTVLLKRLQRETDSFDGRQWVIPTHGRRNEQIGAISSTSTTLPTAANQSYQGFDNATYKPTYNVGVVKLDQRLIDQTKTREGAFVKALSAEVQGIAKDMPTDVNRQFFGDGSGALTACGTTTASTSVTVTSTTKLRVGMPVDVIVSADGTTGTGATGRYVSSITSATVFVISGAAITTDSTYSVYRAGNRNNESNGLQNIVKATGALGGLNPATAGQEYWASTVYGSVGTISEAQMQKGFDAPAESRYGTGDDPTLIISTFGARRAWFNLLTSLKRFTNTTDLEGGFKALDFNGRPFVVDRDAAPSGAIYFLNESNFMIAQVTEPGFMDDDGHILKWDTALGYTAVYRWWINLAVNSRDAHSALTGVTES